MVGTVAASVELKVSADKFWEKVNERNSVVPKLMPDVVASSEFLEGNGGPGTIRLLKFGPAISSFVTFSKEKLEVVDEAKKTMIYSVIGGELLKLFKLYRVSLRIVQGAEKNSCIVNWSVEYEPVAPDVAPPEIAKVGAISTFKALEGYILGKISVPASSSSSRISI